MASLWLALIWKKVYSGSLINIGEVIEIVERNSNSAYDCCVYVLIYALKKGMDSSLHPLSNGQIVGYIAPFGVGVHPV